MEEIFKTYQIHPLMQRMINEIWRAETAKDPEIRDLAIDLLTQDMGTQGIVANRGQVGWFLDQQMEARDGEAEMNSESVAPWFDAEGNPLNEDGMRI